MQMNMRQAIETCLKKVFTIQGRARRSEYWWFHLATAIVGAALGTTANILAYIPYIGWLFALTLWIVSIFLSIPFYTASIRRLHDLGKSGWWVLLHLACCVGSIILLIWFTKQGTIGDNEYGPDPKADETNPNDPTQADAPITPTVEPEQNQLQHCNAATQQQGQPAQEEAILAELEQDEPTLVPNPEETQIIKHDTL